MMFPILYALISIGAAVIAGGAVAGWNDTDSWGLVAFLR